MTVAQSERAGNKQTNSRTAQQPKNVPSRDLLKFIYRYQRFLSFKYIMYADDTTLFSNLTSFGNNIQTKEYLINAEMSNVFEWLNINN